MDQTAAVAQLERMIGNATEPTLTHDALLDLLREARRPDMAGNDPRNTDTATVWSPSTVYAPGDHVRQGVGVERWWVCVYGGRSGASAPAWPDLERLPRQTVTVGDGGVTWLDAGSRWAGRYDMNRAAAAGWEARAALVAHRFDFATDGQSFDVGAIFAHMAAMADRYRNRCTGSVPQ